MDDGKLRNLVSALGGPETRAEASVIFGPPSEVTQFKQRMDRAEAKVAEKLFDAVTSHPDWRIEVQPILNELREMKVYYAFAVAIEQIPQEKKTTAIVHVAKPPSGPKPFEITTNDRRFLKSLRIAQDYPDDSETQAS